jgi:hypothetical protein
MGYTKNVEGGGSGPRFFKCKSGTKFLIFTNGVEKIHFVDPFFSGKIDNNPPSELV